MNKLLGNRLFGLLFREGLGVAAGNQIRKLIGKLVAIIVYYAIIAVLVLAGIAFLYLLIYEWIAELIDPISAAAILSGANLLLVALMLIIRQVSRRRRSRAMPPLTSVVAANPAMEAGVAIGRDLNVRLRKTAPQFVLAAAVVGLVIGIRPQLLGAFRRPSKQRVPAGMPQKQR